MEREDGAARAPRREKMPAGQPAGDPGKLRLALLAEMKEEALALREHLKAWLALEKEGAFAEVAGAVFACLARLEELRGHYNSLGPAGEEGRDQILSLLGELRSLQEENERLLSGIKEKLASCISAIQRARELGTYLKQASLQEKYSFQVPLVDAKR